MQNLNPTIELEKILGGQIYDALQGGVVEAVLKKAKLNSGDDYWRSNMEGHSIKITKPLLKDLYGLCQEVKDRLGFEEPVKYSVPCVKSFFIEDASPRENTHPLFKSSRKPSA